MCVPLNKVTCPYSQNNEHTKVMPSISENFYINLKQITPDLGSETHTGGKLLEPPISGTNYLLYQNKYVIEFPKD